MTPQPPVELTCATHASALTSLLRLAHNALSVALLASRNVTCPGVHTGAPNVSKVHAVGGSEVQVKEGLKGRILEAEIRQGMAAPGTEARQKADAALNRLERDLAAIEAQIAALDTGKRVTPGLRDTYRVTIPALHARVAGVMYVSDCVTIEVEVDPETPRYEEYLGRNEWAGHQGSGPQPLYKVRGDRTRLLPASEAQPWHADLIAALWADRSLPELRVAVPEVDLFRFARAQGIPIRPSADARAYIDAITGKGYGPETE